MQFSLGTGLAVRPLRRLQPSALVMLVDAVFQPAPTGLTSEQINFVLIEFCLNCPDPVGAMDAVLQAPQAASAAEVTRAALAMTTRSVDSWPESELHADHPLRRFHLPPGLTGSSC